MRPRKDMRIGVFLNEALVFHFSSEVDAASVTSESLVVRPVGKSTTASGRFEIDGKRVRFVPDLGLARDLSDGGFWPGTRYEVLIRGFPAPDGIRSTEGWPLGQSARFYFETAALTEPRTQMFDDRTPAMGAALRLERVGQGNVQLDRNKSIVLVCAEPLDPSTLLDGEFVLQSAEKEMEPIPLDPNLVKNSHHAGARLELWPRRFLEEGLYYLRPRDPGGSGLTIRDFGGNQVWFLGHSGDRLIEVLDGGEERRPIVEHFLNTDNNSPLVVPGVDGSAYWGDNGVVTVRFPFIAGTGADGACVLEGGESRKDIHSTSLQVGKGNAAQLISVPGLVVLRAQGKVSIEGRITRRAGEDAGMTESFRKGEAISAWLERAKRDDENWTVIVAGGDLVIDGDVEIDGPLLLAAGGRIRITGKVRGQKNQLWLVGDGGGGDLDPTVSRAPLTLDPPYLNPLVEPLTYAVLSSPIPQDGSVRRWLRSHVEGKERNGTYKVSYLPADPPFGRPLDEWGAVEFPNELLDAGSLRILIHMRVDPIGQENERAGFWYPPVIDDVRLTWEP